MRGHHHGSYDIFTSLILDHREPSLHYFHAIRAKKVAKEISLWKLSVHIER